MFIFILYYYLLSTKAPIILVNKDYH